MTRYGAANPGREGFTVKLRRWWMRWSEAVECEARHPMTCRLLFLLCLACLAGCVPRKDGRKEITYAFWGSTEQQKIERSIVEAFEKENPDIKVNLLPIGGSRYAEKVQAMLVGKVAPDVVMVEMNQYLEWAARGALVDLTEDVAAMTSDRPLMPLPQAAFACRGKFYAMPANCCGLAMYYNADALKKAGIRPAELKTWRDLQRLAPRLSRRAGDPGAPTDYALLMPPALIPFWAFGGELFDDLRHPTRVTVQTPAALDAIKFLREMDAAGYAVPPDVSSDQGTYQLFRDGKVAIMFDGRWRTPELAGKTAFAWDVMPIPAGPVRRITIHGGTGLAVTRDSKEIGAARKFVKFYMSPEAQKLAVEGGRLVPVFRDEAMGKDFLALRPPEHMEVFSATMEDGASSLAAYCPGASQVRDIFSSRMEEVLSEPDRPAEEILKGLDADLNRWLQRQQRKGFL